MLSDIIGKFVSMYRGTELFEGRPYTGTVEVTVEANKDQKIDTSGFDTEQFKKALGKVDLNAIPVDTQIIHKPIYVGITSTGHDDPKLRMYYAMMEEYFNLFNINTQFQFNRYVFCSDLCRMNKTPRKAAAIPDPDYWQYMATTIRYIAGPLVKEFGANVDIENGYRSEDYNKAVKGARNSRHIFFQALDIDYDDGSFETEGTNSDYQRKMLIAMIKFCAKIYNSPEGRKCRMGFGVYGTLEHPTRFHIDTCHKQRYWGRAGSFL